MKFTHQILSSLAVSGLLLIAVDSALAQTAVKEVTTTTTNAAGMISDFGPETITIRTEAAPEPVRYTYTKKTTYVDEQGAPVSIETVKSGLPVTVYYSADGDRMVATRVVVRRGAATTTDAAVNTVGTISEFSPETLVVRTEKSAEPVRYRYSKTTTYVDETGAPVSMETVKSGLPVTVYYTKTADGMTASKVIVRKAVVKEEPVIQRKTTTTTTTTTTK